MTTRRPGPGKATSRKRTPPKGAAHSTVSDAAGKTAAVSASEAADALQRRMGATQVIAARERAVAAVAAARVE